MLNLLAVKEGFIEGIMDNNLWLKHFKLITETPNQN
jgi:hypothetical protein